MNKIFRVIWSDVTQSWVAVSELTKAHKKKSATADLKLNEIMHSLSCVFKISALALALSSNIGLAYAAFEADGGKATGTFSVAISNATASSSNAIAIGSAKATAEGTLAVIRGANASGARSMAIGIGSQSSAEDSIAVGRDAKATATDAIALGREAKSSGKNATALGISSNAAGQSAVALGDSANAAGQNAAALGKGANAAGPSSVALGDGANASAQQAIAIGFTAKAIALDTLAMMRNANASGDRAMALGISASATGEDSLAMQRDSKANGKFSIAVGYKAETQQNNGVAIGTEAKTSNGPTGISIGFQAGKYSSQAKDNNSNIHIGAYSRTGWDGTNPTGNNNSPGREGNVNQKATQSIAIGSGNDSNQGAWAEGDQSISIGANTHARGDSSIAIGGDDVDRVAEKKITYTDKNGNQKGGTIEEAMVSLTGISLQAHSYKDTTADGASIAIGIKTRAADLALALGSLAEAQKVNTVAIGSGAIAALDNAVSIGGGAVAGEVKKAGNTQHNNKKIKNIGGQEFIEDSLGTKQTGTTIGGVKYTWAGGTDVLDGDIVSFGTIGYERQMKNVAAGKVSADSTDGINGSQLYSVAEKIVTHNYLKYAGDDGQPAAGSNTRDDAKLIKQNLDGHQLDIIGGADKDKLTDKNIGVNNVGGKLKVQLAKELANLTSANFTNAAGDVTTVNSDGITITPNTSAPNQANKAPVTLTKNGLDNGNNIITNVAGNLPDTHNKITGNNPQDATKKQDAPTVVTSNAATVGDILNSGWNLQGNGSAVDFVRTYDTVNFVDGDGTEVEVKSEDGKTSTVKVKVKKTTFTTTDGNITATTEGDTFATAGDVATEINKRRIKYFSVKSDVVGNSLNDGAKGTNSIAIGPNASTASDKVRGDGSIEESNAGIAIGMNANSKGTNAIAVGPNANAAANGVVMGINATTEKVDSIAIGRNAKTKEINGTAVGFGASAGNENSAAFGYGSNASGPGSVAIGTTAKAIDSRSKDIHTEAIGNFATAVGVGVKADGTNAFAAGYLAKTAAQWAVAIGSGAQVDGNPKDLTGAGTVAIGLNAWGKSSSVVGVAIGNNAIVESKRGIALGTSSYANVEGGITGVAMDSDDRHNVYANLTGVAKTSDAKLGAVSIGANKAVQNVDGRATLAVATRQLVNLAAGKEDTDAVNVAQLKSVNLGFTGNSGKGDVRLFDQRVAIKGAEGSFITTTASNATVEITTTRATLTPNTATGVVDAPENDGLTTAKNVANAINNAAWKAKATNTSNGESSGGADHKVKAGDLVNFEADKNIKITQAEGKFTFATKDNVEFNSVQLGSNTGPKLTNDGDNIKVGNKDGQPTKITNLADGEVTKTSKDAINGSQLYALASNTIKLSAVNKFGNSDGAKTSTTPQNLNKENGLEFNVKSADGELLAVKAEGDTITLTPVKGSVQIDKDGKASISKGAKTTEGLVEAGDLVEALNQMGWKVTSGTEGTGNTATGHATSTPIVKFGETVTFKAGDNLLVKQAGKDFTYSLNPALSGLTSAQFKNGDNILNITPTGITISKPADPATQTPAKTVTLNQDGLNNGGNHIANVAGNLPETRNTAAGENKPVTTSQTAPNIGTNVGDVNESNAATVGDVLNAGWNLKNNTKDVDFVKAYDTVDFTNGTGTTVEVKSDDHATSTVKVNVKTDGSTITVNSDGNVSAVTGDTSVVENTAGNKKKGQVQANSGDEHKLVTVENMTKAVNAAKWFTKADNADTAISDNDKTTNDNGEAMSAGDVLTLTAGKNLRVKREAQNFTFATADNVDFTTVKVGAPESYTDENNQPLVKVNGKYYKPEDVKNGVPDTTKEVPAENVKIVKPQVNLAREEAKPANNNAEDKKPTTALNITSTDGKPTQLTGVGSSLNVTNIETAPQGKDGNYANGKPNASLIDLNGTTAAPINKNAAATVGDLANMGWVVSTQEGNGYVDVVKNANKVDFKGDGLASVKGETLANGTRQITVSVKGGEVTPTDATLKDHPDTKLVKVGDKYYKAEDIDPTGKPKQGVNAVEAGDVVTTQNNGAGFVTGNQVGDAIQASGFVIGKQKTALTAEDYKDEDERVNPDDNIRFADGNNTQVKLATKESVDASGKKVTTTTVKVDVTGLPVQYTDKDGNRVTKVGDQFYKVDAKGNPTGNALTNDEAGNLIASAVNPNATQNKAGDAVTFSNIKSNLPETRNKDDEVDPSGKPKTTAQAAPNITDKTDSHYVNPNNAATVGDVLNAGWNLQSNGSAVDFVKTYDTVNVVDGKGTKAVVTTADNLVSNISFDVDNIDITVDEKTGAITTPKQAAENKVKAAEEALAKAPTDEALKKAVEEAKANLADINNKVATAQNVAEAISKSGFTLKTSANGGEKLSGADELINPSDVVDMAAGKNLTVKQDEHGKVTYATADNVDFTTVKVGAPESYTDENNQPLVKVNGKYYKQGDVVNGVPTDTAQPVPDNQVKTVNPQVNLAREEAKPATNNAEGKNRLPP